jgi:hypothetical protein
MLSGPIWQTRSVSVWLLSWREVERESPRPAWGCQEEVTLAVVHSPSWRVAVVETNVFRPAKHASLNMQ